MLLLLACAPTSDIKTDTCDEGFEIHSDGHCYEIEAADADTDTDGDADADSDSDADSDTDADTDTGPIDADGDGSTYNDDCDDNDATRHPGASETCNGLDDDCDGTSDEGVTSTFFEDFDGDGYGDADEMVQACEPDAGRVADSADCDDDDADVHPGAADDQPDGIDNDCDGTADEDWDPCATPFGRIEHTSDTYVRTTTGGMFSYLDGTGWVCTITCPDWWLTGDGVTLDNGTTYEALPYYLDGSASLGWSNSDPGADATSECTITTSAGDFTFGVTFYG